MTKSIKISHSSCETYSLCPRKYYLQNIEKLAPLQKSSSLLIGIAFDNAFNDILLNYQKSPVELFRIGLRSFNKFWKEQEDKFQGKFELAKNPNILYSKKDLDEEILTPRDGEKIELYFNKLTISRGFDSGYNLFNLLREKHSSFQYWDTESKSLYNYINWLSIKRKAPYILKAYIRDFIPKIDKVVSVQDELSLSCGDDSLVGIADFIVQLKPGTYNGISVAAGENIIADNKSSSKGYLNKSYGSNSVQESSQLAKYKEILNDQKNMNIDKGAYFVFVKELQRIQNKTCKSCGHKVTGGLLKTCDNKINKKRCGGEWQIDITFDVETRLVVDHIPDETIQKALDKVDETINNIREEKFDPNYESCNWQFGNRCPFFEYCESGSMEGLIKGKK